MRFLFFPILIGLMAPAWGQQSSPIEQEIKNVLGELVFSNSLLRSQNGVLTNENAKLKTEIEELKNKLDSRQKTK